MSTNPTFPKPWEIESHRNGPTCRTWHFVTRYLTPTRVEYLNDVTGAHPKPFRARAEAVRAMNAANAAAELAVLERMREVTINNGNAPVQIDARIAELRAAA